MLSLQNHWHQFSKTRVWRIPVTGFAFAVFGLGALFFSVTIFPLLYVLPINKSRKTSWSRKLIASVFYIYIKFLRGLGLLSVELHDLDELRKPNQLIVANHPSLLDVVFLIAVSGEASCIVKSGLWRNPVTFMPVSSAGYISNQDENLFQQCLTRLQQGESLIIFPEGTRTRPSEPLKFHRGFANIALSSQKKITPVLIHCEPATLMKHQKWYQVSATPPHFTLRVLPPLDVLHYMSDGQLQSAAARQLTRDLVEYFTHQLAQLKSTK